MVLIDPLSSIPVEMPHRALIFCQWKSSVQLVSGALSRGDFGAPISHLVLDGSVAPSDRQSIVDRFNTDHLIDVLVLTTHIGGVGLNLTGADVVIFLDHDWNPMKDLQAIDRAHRIGQTRKVNVYRLITQGTIEDKVMSLHKFKQDTADVSFWFFFCMFLAYFGRLHLPFFYIPLNFFLDMNFCAVKPHCEAL
ncbi:helicase protein [Ancylostoma duodenale]|uniref:Helicase protein n=1 Tax=Ancylostoma duodenale TaxID=51022 RepID=A0A0C2C361_9BILA|nr:helicase protein [Ancylostoma duodenale]